VLTWRVASIRKYSGTQVAPPSLEWSAAQLKWFGHLPAFVSNTRRVVPAYTMWFASSTTPILVDDSEPVERLRGAPDALVARQRGGGLRGDVHGPLTDEEVELRCFRRGAFRVGPCCAADGPVPDRTYDSDSSRMR